MNMMWQVFRALFFISILGTFGQDIMFPDDERLEERISGSSNRPLTERLPIFVEGRCPPNMLLYPGDGNTSVWECDCRAGFVYFPLNNSCYEPYTQGPCPAQHHVILPPGEVLPRCERNPCLEKDFVLYKNECHMLLKLGSPCSPSEHLAVNDTTFQLECTSEGINPLILIDAPANRCPNGSRRNTLGQCRRMI